ncbi:MAG TPA: nuclear transport factor 2 family protein [Acidimicrobiia bacterium]|nr:nuclear transport factor 2 family protein [Acidimicrobiia bacterium]
MAEHPNVTMYREIHEKLQQGDFEAVFEALDDEVVWHQLGAETLHGKEAVRESMSGMEEFGADAFDLDLHDVVGNDEHVVGLVEATLNMGDQSFTYRTAEIAHMKDGKVTERWAFSDDTQRIIEFFGSIGGE